MPRFTRRWTAEEVRQAYKEEYGIGPEDYESGAEDMLKTFSQVAAYTQDTYCTLPQVLTLVDYDLYQKWS
jgi:hypothetical protein